MENAVNRVNLCGTLCDLPSLSHENHGRRFYSFTLNVPRLSGASDLLPILAAEDILNTIDLSGGSCLKIEGQLRSFNSRKETGRRLILSVFAETIQSCEDEPENEVALTGAICKMPVYRQTPLGREICDIMLAVQRRYRRTDYVPCILWGRTAQDAAELPVGTALELHGRLQSREYVKVLDNRRETRTTYELSVMEAYQLPEDPS
ncbi:MAG: single-stranded DNA-binding protein [Oscillospiraceae bacterium]|nr:single-stranded DNA-binding protein [Oscillospiraceae bacterium]